MGTSKIALRAMTMAQKSRRFAAAVRWRLPETGRSDALSSAPTGETRAAHHAAQAAASASIPIDLRRQTHGTRYNDETLFAQRRERARRPDTPNKRPACDKRV
jgi:hypothetical protein